MNGRNGMARVRRFMVGSVVLGIVFLGGMNTGCSMSSTLSETVVSAGVTLAIYAVESLLGISTTS